LWDTIHEGEIAGSWMSPHLIPTNDRKIANKRFTFDLGRQYHPTSNFLCEVRASNGEIELQKGTTVLKNISNEENKGNFPGFLELFGSFKLFVGKPGQNVCSQFF
jgi:hypothetical protein